MAKIKKLSKDNILKIAAGEVIERPANVVKELIENSLDAYCTEISIYIKNAGKDLIQIIDNGCGMSHEDAILSIEKHTTSKLFSINDLKSLSTFGFRGEALASIAAISKMTLITKEESNETGIRLKIDEGKIVDQSITTSNTGTNITINDLFFNIPARKKFLKTKETEWRAILHLFQAFSLANLHVHFKLFSENKLIHNLPISNSIITRIAQVFDINLAQQLLEFKDKNEQCSIHGVLSNPHYYRYDRNLIFLFVNNRLIKDHKLVQAFIRGYQNILPSDKFPMGVIFITINPELIDFNIHPRKEEIQFLHPKIIQQMLSQIVKMQLEKYMDEKLGVDKNLIEKKSIIKDENNFIKEPSQNQIKFANIKNDQDFSSNLIEKKSFYTILNNSFFKTDVLPIFAQQNKFQKIDSSNIEQQDIYKNELKKESINYKLIGQLFLTYIIIETEQNLVLIDQHAANERIIFERMKENFNLAQSKVKLLFPQNIYINNQDIELVEPYFNLFDNFGLSLEVIGKSELILKETPIFLKNQPIDDIIKQTITLIKENTEISDTELQKLIVKKLHSQLSCKAAVKAGDELSIESMHQIIKDLYNIDNKLTCPHGRPTFWNISIKEIEKKFKRDYK